MLRLGKLADYGLLITTFLAKNNRQATTEEISQALKLSTATVRKLMKMLVDAKIVESHRGVKGGYCLASNPENIKITQVIQAVSGPIQITDCCDKSFECEKGAACDQVSNWQYLNELVIKQFSNISVSDMTGDLRLKSS